MYLKSKLIAVLSLCVLSQAYAGGTYNFDVNPEDAQTVELTEISVDENGNEIEKAVETNKNFVLAKTRNSTAKRVGALNVLMVTKELIALGKEIYKIVDAGRPVVKVESEPVDILPRNEHGVTFDRLSLENWKAPKAKTYRVKMKNLYGVTTVDFKFMIIFSYGGQLDGKGKYIAGAQIKPKLVDVKWGYTFEAEYKLETILNEGSSKDPVVGAILELDYGISTVMQDRKKNVTFYINGNGDLQLY